MKGKLEQPDLGISTKEYLELVLHNKKVTRRSVNALANHPISLPPQVPLGRKHSTNSNKDKIKSPKDFEHPNAKTRSNRHYSEDHGSMAESAELLNIQTKQEPSQSSTQQSSRANRHSQPQKAPKPFKFQDVTLEITKPIRLFSFEQMAPLVRNEFALGPNLLKHRHIKVVQREVLDNMEKFMFYNAFITKRNKNDFSQISIEYFDDKLNQNPELSTLLNLENQKDRSFILTQDIGLVELDETGFEMLFSRVDPGELSFDVMKSKNNLVYWPVVVMNNCAVDSKTREFLTVEVDDDCDYLREFFIEGLDHHYPVVKMEDAHAIKKEDLSLFEDDQESNGGQTLGKEDLLRVREELKEIFTDEDDEDEDGNQGMEEEKNDNTKGNNAGKRKKKGRKGDNDNLFGSEGDDSESLRSLEEELKKENNDGKRMFDQLEKGRTPRKTPEKGKHEIKKEDGDDSDGSVIFVDLPLHKKVKHEDEHVNLKKEKIEEDFYEHNVANELDEEGTVMVWFVGTGYYQLRKVYDIKPLNNENKAHLMAISKKTKFLNKMLHHFSKIIKNYNVSTGDSDYSLPISNKVMKENLLRVIYLGTEDKGLVPMIPLLIKEKKNENFTILRVLDDYSLLMIKNNDSKTVVKISSYLPPLEPLIIERLDNLAIFNNYNKEVFTKKVLFPTLYPKNLIDVNYNSLRVAHKRTTTHKQTMAVEDPTITRNIRCKQCKYILGDLPYHKCNKCDEYFHDHCVEEKKPNPALELQKNNGKAEKRHSGNWLCKNCKNCSYCIGNSNREHLLFCINCDEAYHTFCIQALHHNYRIDSEFKASRFICTECALCQMCGCEINNFSDKNIVEEGLTLCNDCIEVRLKKEYCPICNRRWDYMQHAASKEEIEMIECQCKMWVHRNCDTELSKDTFKEFAITGRVYHCPGCRKTFKNKQLVEFINVLMDLDEHKFFTMPVDEKSAPNYRTVISYPMDFETMTKKAMNNDYLEDPYNQLKVDFDLICNNAMIYNMPKSQVFGIAKKLKKFGDKAFQFFKELIDCPDREFLKFSRKLTPNHYISQFKKEIDEYYLDILFEENEMNPLTRIRVIDNTKNHNFNNSTSNSRKTYNKEVIIEITGLNHLLTERAVRDDKRALENRSRYDHSDRKAQANLEESDAITEYDSRRLDTAPAFEEEVKNQMSWNKMITREGVALIEELLSQSSKNKPFFYFNPVVIQFTNPDMVKQDICYLCGSFDENASYLFCSVCQEGYHYYCISKSYNDMAKFDRLKASANWQCPKCKLCQQCHKKSESHDCLICETCDNLYHINCIYPQIGVLFPSEWRCEECFRCSRCGSNKLFSDNLNVESGNIQPEFCEDFKWCYECGLKMAYFKFCKICKKYCQKSISSNKNDNRSLQYINPVEDSVECSVCKFKYHISCYEEEYYALNSYDDFVCYNCKIDDEEVTKIETELEEKAEKIITKRRIVKHLLRMCESIFNQYLTPQHAKSEAFKENLSKMIFDYIIEDYEFLTRETHIKSMLENYKLLNTATKLIGTKYVPQIAHTSSARNENAMVAEKLQDSEHLDVSFLNYACELFDFLARIPIMYSDLLEPYHELACLIALKDKQTEVLPTETSREYYDYKGFIKFRDDELDFWMLLPLETIYEDNVPLQNYCMASDLMLTSAICLKQELKNSLAEQLDKPEPRLLKKTAQLVTLNALLQDNDPYYFERLNEQETLSIDEKLGELVDHVTEIVWAPYWKTLEDMRLTLYLRSISENIERPGLLIAREGLDQEIFELLFYRDNIKVPVSIVGLLDSERVNPFAWVDASTSSAKRHREEMRYYEELKNLMFTEMVAIEVIKRRMKTWFEMKKENTHAGRNRSGSTKMIKPMEKSHHNGLIAAIDGPNHMAIEQTNNNHSFSSRMVTEEPESSGIKGSAIKPNKMSEEVDVDVVEGDTVLESPMSNTECICCKLTGDRKLSGRLLFVDCDQWVHTNCALWSYDVFENIEGGLVNFIIAYRRSLATVCSYCNKSGATIFCFSKKCQHKYHFQCSFLAKCSFLTCKKFYCKNCSLTKNLSNKVNTDFSTYRRLYIVRNQTLFYMESTKNSRYIKEKPLELQSGAFNRVGNLTVISAKKYNSDLKFLISEYAVTKIITQNHERKPIFITLTLQDSLYHYKFSRIDDSVLLNKKSLYAQKMSQEGEENLKVLETAENFFENLATFLGNTPTTTGHKDKISKKELLGEFLALYSFDVRRWLKSSIMIDEEEASEKKEYPSFKEYYYSHKIDEMDAFSREEKVKEIYGKIIPKIQTLVQNFNTKEEAERLKNPKERSFNRMTKRIKTNKRKTESLGHFGFGADGAEEIMPENHFAVPIDNAKYTKIQSTELENKLKADYWPHKKKPSKVLVAPSPIHKYGLFALENFNKNEIVIEYCGEVIRNKIADLRENQYKQQGFGDCFMFRADKDAVIDATFKGNQARYLNHSCNPNCSSTIIEIDGEPKIMMYANRPIYAGEELTYDYQFDVEAEKIECTCGAKNCQGRLN